MSYEFYKVLHFLGIILLFFGLGGLLVVNYGRAQIQKQARMMAMMGHGVGLLLIIVSGFGLAARLGLARSMPGWIHAKIAIWVLLGISISLVKRKGYIGWPVAILLWGLGFTAAFLAVNKPF